MLFMISGIYTSKALDAMRENPNTDRTAALSKLTTSAGGKVVGVYFTLAEGPGAYAIIDADPVAAAAIVGTLSSSGGFRDIKMIRLWTHDEAVAIRKKRAEIHAAYNAPGQ